MRSKPAPSDISHCNLLLLYRTARDVIWMSLILGRMDHRIVSIILFAILNSSLLDGNSTAAGDDPVCPLLPLELTVNYYDAIHSFVPPNFFFSCKLGCCRMETWATTPPSQPNYSNIMRSLVAGLWRMEEESAICGFSCAYKTVNWIYFSIPCTDLDKYYYQMTCYVLVGTCNWCTLIQLEHPRLIGQKLLSSRQQKPIKCLNSRDSLLNGWDSNAH